MSNYALVKNGVVENVVVWDGTGGIFDDYITVNIDGISAGIDWTYDGEALPLRQKLLRRGVGHSISGAFDVSIRISSTRYFFHSDKAAASSVVAIPASTASCLHDISSSAADFKVDFW